MKNKFIFKLFSALLMALCLWAVPAWAAEPVEVMVFTSPYCPHCRHMEQDGFVDAFAAKHKGEITVTHYDVTQDAGNIVFLQILKEKDVKSSGIPAMVIGDEVLQGYPRSIGNRSEEVLQALLQSRRAEEAAQKQAAAKKTVKKEAAQSKPAAAVQKAKAQTAVKKQEAQPAPAQGAKAAEAAQTAPAKAETNAQPATPEPEAAAQDAALAQHEAFFNQITVWAIIGAGLADGINPCAFAVIVFFISFLAVYKYNRKEIILVGSAYCASVFAAYMLLGLGFFRFLYAMKGLTYITLAIQWATIALCALFFVLSLYDFWIYRKTKQSDKMLLQLPRSYKEYIHKVMRFFLKDKHSSSWRLVLAACCVGFVVSLVEAVCTGQVYLPTIMVILKEADKHFFKAAEYLVLYNLMFIVPLVLVFVLALCGKESATFNNWLKKHLGLTKLLLCCVFLGLLLLLLFNM